MRIDDDWERRELSPKVFEWFDFHDPRDRRIRDHDICRAMDDRCVEFRPGDDGGERVLRAEDDPEMGHQGTWEESDDVHVGEYRGPGSCS